MTRSAGRAVAWLIIAPLSLLVFGSGCALDNPSYCIDDDVCADRRANDPSVGPICHSVGHFCTTRCTGNDYCADETKPGYSPSTPICNARGHCEGAVPDGGGKRALGSRCSEGSQCDSGLCAKGHCCDQSCSGSCRTCATGKCEVIAPGKSCDDPSKSDTCGADGRILRWICNAAEICVQSDDSCGGYVCDDSGGPAECLKKCSSEAQCASTYACKGTECTGKEKPGVECGTNDALCASGMCVDGHCCEVPACGECNACGTDGKCGPLPQGPAPGGQCAGEAQCGGGTCDGAGKCAYKPSGTACGSRKCATSGAPAVEQDACDGAGKCVAKAKVTPCTPYSCQSAPSIDCKTSCQSSADCEPGGACDRRDSHTLAGNVGQCIASSNVLVLSGQTLAQGIGALGGKQVLRVSGGPFAESLNILARTVRIIADTPVTIAPASTSPGVQLGSGATLQLQGVTIDGGSGGIVCNSSTLVLLDSTIRSANGPGIESNKCDVTLRRNSIIENRGGGVDLVDGQIAVTNNVIAGNGNFGVSAVGGLSVTRINGGAVTLYNNTLAGNVSQATVGAGAACSGSVTLVNMIVWGNSAPEQSGCSFNYSIAPSGVGGTGNESADPLFQDALSRDYHIKAGSPAIDRGDPAASSSTVSTIDRAGSARVQGGRIDRGAYELK